MKKMFHEKKKEKISIILISFTNKKILGALEVQ